MSKISFIIPVYNVKDYITQCVESIASQASEEVEIILVDDGSTDCSGAMCDAFAEKYPIVCVFHQKNAGHSAARNFGLNKATGKYVVFVDSDDFIGANSVCKIINWIDNNDEDLCFMNFYKYFPDGKTQLVDRYPDSSIIKGNLADKALEIIARGEKFPGSACGKLFKRERLVRNNIVFPLDLRHGEDLTFMINCYANFDSFDYLNIDYYYYRQERKDSITASVDKTQICANLSTFVINTIKYSEGFPDKKDSLLNFAAYEYLIVLSAYCLLKNDAKNKTKTFLNEYKWVLKHGTSKKIRILRLITKVLGLKLTSILMRTWMNIR